MNKEGNSNIEEVLSELLGVVPSEIVDKVKELRETHIRLEDKLNTMNTKGTASLVWVNEVFFQVLTGHFKGR